MATSAKIIADSISSTGKRITTFEVEFPRIILAEVNTHRVLSRNYQSSRAVPLDKQIELIEKDGFVPSPFTKNQPGMKANEPIESGLGEQLKAEIFWNTAKENAIKIVKGLQLLGVSKQHAGRLLEPFIYIKGVITATEWENFFNLRDHEDAQPEFQVLARKMREAMNRSTPLELEDDDWHVPYYKSGMWSPEFDEQLQNALDISVSCCAQVSYRKVDDSLEKARQLITRLKGDGKSNIHFSPFEHQATPFAEYDPFPRTSGNFKGWKQYRKVIEHD